MDSLGREQTQLIRRAVIALEKLAEDPVLQIEAGPPICPHCQTINPEVTVVADSGGKGPLSEFAILPECGSCEQKFYAVPIEWAIFTTHQEAEKEIENRREVFGSVVNN
jgi:hypothetical protein